MEPLTHETFLLVEARSAALSGRGARVRAMAGLSQAELASAIGVTPACISHWEAGSRRPRGEAAVAYARLLRVLGEEIVRR